MKPTNKKIKLLTGSGTLKTVVQLVAVTCSRVKSTHNHDSKFTYQKGIDSFGNLYETKSRGGGWRKV